MWTFADSFGSGGTEAAATGKTGANLHELSGLRRKLLAVIGEELLNDVRELEKARAAAIRTEYFISTIAVFELKDSVLEGLELNTTQLEQVKTWDKENRLGKAQLVAKGHEVEIGLIEQKMEKLVKNVLEMKSLADVVSEEDKQFVLEQFKCLLKKTKFNAAMAVLEGRKGQTSEKKEVKLTEQDGLKTSTQVGNSGNGGGKKRTNTPVARRTRGRSQNVNV